MARYKLIVILTSITTLLTCNTRSGTSQQTLKSEAKQRMAIESYFESVANDFQDSGLSEVLASIENIQDKEKVFAIIKAYYPQYIQSIELDANDVIFNINGKKIYYRGGKMLFGEHLDDSSQYRSIMYPYRLEALKDFIDDIPPASNNFSAKYIRRSDFQIALLGNDVNSIQNSISEFKILDFKVRMHPMAAEQAKKASEKILELAKYDNELNMFLKSLKTISGHYQRNVRNSSNISMHSFGLALDLIPYTYDSKHTYWQWTKQHYPDTWQNFGIDKRWLLPQKIVEVFELYGFIWGGKWTHYDTMHLEYRPELIEFARIRRLIDDIK